MQNLQPAIEFLILVIMETDRLKIVAESSDAVAVSRIVNPTYDFFEIIITATLGALACRA